MAGVFEGAGHWRLDFIDGGVLVNCSFLSPNQESYKIEFKPSQTLLVVNTRPKPLVLTLKADGTIRGRGQVTIDGVVAAAGYSAGTSAPRALGDEDSHHPSGNERDGGSDARWRVGPLQPGRRCLRLGPHLKPKLRMSPELRLLGLYELLAETGYMSCAEPLL